MPDRDVKTVDDVIFFQYAKIIARSAFKGGDGMDEICGYRQRGGYESLI